jgi:hypothetical protein
MRSKRSVSLGHVATSIGAISVVAPFLLMTPIRAGAQSPTADQTKQAACVAIVSPAVEGVPGNATDAANGVRDLIASYLQGPAIKPIVLDAKLPSLAAEEAKQKGCQSLLLTSVHRKSGGGHGFMKALSHAAGTAPWNLPYGGSASSTAARAGTTAALQTVSLLAQSTKAKDEISLEYRLQSATGQIEFGPRTERRTAKADGEDLLTPIVTLAAEAIVTSNAATRPTQPDQETKQQ